MAGRFHYYEGPPRRRGLPTFSGCLGRKEFILTNAAGAVNAPIAGGDLVPPPRHSNSWSQSFRGETRRSRRRPLGPRFFDMGKAWSPAFRARRPGTGADVLGAAW
jgi:purine nucleoside phosphorylase